MVPVSLATVPVAPADGLIQFPPVDAEHILVNMDTGPVMLFECDNRYMFTTGLATCTAISVSGVYPLLSRNSPPGTRYNRFLVHRSELEWETHFDALEDQVLHAMILGLHDLHIHVVAAHPETYYEDQRDVDDSYEAQRSLMAKLWALLGLEEGADDSDSDSDSAARIQWYPYQQDWK